MIPTPAPAGLPAAPGRAPVPGAGAAAPGGPPGGTGAATAVGGALGNRAAGFAKLDAALKLLQDALPGLPMGSEVHGAVLEAVKKIGKHMPQGGAGVQDPNAMIQQLALLARNARQAPAQQAALQHLMPPPPAMTPAPGAAGEQE